MTLKKAEWMKRIQVEDTKKFGIKEFVAVLDMLLKES